jgi:hypothetical protein
MKFKIGEKVTWIWEKKKYKAIIAGQLLEESSDMWMWVLKFKNNKTRRIPVYGSDFKKGW